MALSFSSCEKDEETNAKPEIDLHELGYENSKIAYAGSELHIDAEIVAEAKIDKVHIEIHSESEHKDGEWHVDTTYTKFSDLKNTNFHEHLDVSSDADTGHYHFHFSVTDMEGQQTIIEDELEVKLPNDTVNPSISVSSAPSNNQMFNNGDNISISGTVTDDKALGGMYIGLVRVDQNLSDADVNATNTITLLHTHDFDNPDSHNFSANINVGAAQDNNVPPKDITGNIAWQTADYYIIVKVKDAFGGNWEFSSHYPIKINI